MVSTTSSDTRQKIADQVRDSARAALDNRAAEDTARLQILGLLLDPELNAIERAMHSYEHGNPFPTTEREQIAAYVTRAVERKVLNGGTDVVQLDDLVHRSPVAWIDRFARACIPSGVSEVRRSRDRTAPTPALPTSWTPVVDSAEEAFLLREHEDVVDTVTSVVETWESRSMSKHEHVREVAKVLRTLRGVPAPHVRGMTERRWVAGLIETEAGQQQIVDSLLAFRDLASGDPTWEQMEVDDRLLDLWIDYDADQAHTLATGGMNVLVAIVRGAVELPPRPQEAQRVAVRRMAKGMSSETGWSSLVMELERAWVGEFFSARPARDNMDRRSDEQAEAERAAEAAAWPEVAERAVSFPGAPLGTKVRTTVDVARWLENALAATTRR